MTPGEQKLTEELAVAQARITDLEAVLGLSSDNLGVAFRLSVSQHKLLGCLLATPNVTPEMITLRLEIATDAKVAIHRLREALKAPPDDPTKPIPIQSRRGLGYWLEPADKERVRAITLGVTAPAPAQPAEAA